MKKKKWFDVLIVFYIMIINIMIRCYYLSKIDTLFVSGDYLSLAWGQNNSFSISSFDFNQIYTWLLTEIMLFFGKKSVHAIYLNIALQVIGIVVIYGTIRLIFGRLISSIFAIILSVIPYFYGMITDISPFNLINCSILLAIYIVVLLVYGMVHLIQNLFYHKMIYDNDVIQSNLSEEPVIPEGDEAVIETSKESEKPEKTNSTPLETPLPMPKKHIKKEMTYAFEPKFDLMHYDDEDMTGKDFYDIE